MPKRELSNRAPFASSSSSSLANHHFPNGDQSPGSSSFFSATAAHIPIALSPSEATAAAVTIKEARVLTDGEERTLDELSEMLFNEKDEKLASSSSSGGGFGIGHPFKPDHSASPLFYEETKRERKARMNSFGEHRLKITFLSFGVPGETRQTIVFKGKGEAIIPDGLEGTTEVYNEPWMFEIHHRRPVNYERSVLEFSVTNLNSNRKLTRVETGEEAMIRETQARTICNQVLKQAMELRAQEYEELLQDMPEGGHGEMRDSNIEGKIRILRPKRLLIGPLFFGLQHRVVQDHMLAMLQLMHQG